MDFSCTMILLWLDANENSSVRVANSKLNRVEQPSTLAFDPLEKEMAKENVEIERQTRDDASFGLLN